MHQRIFTVIIIVLLIGAATAPARATVGEFSIPDVIPLGEAQRSHLRHLVVTDEEAADLAAQAKHEAVPLLDDEPRPLEVIHYEGLVNTDPRRIATVRKLRDMAKVARLVRYWQTTGDDRAAEAIRRFTIAWTKTYRLTGNDVNENKFQPMLVGYLALRDTFDPGQRQRIDRWVEDLGRLHLKAVRESTHFTNRYAKHVRLLATTARILGRDEWLDEARDGIRRFVRNALYADGTSRDLKRRDSLTYHGSGLKVMLELAMLMGESGRDLYTWTGPDGGSLKKSVDYVVPYAMGRKVHREWVDTKVGLDRRRAKAGLEKYKPGKPYDPNHAQELMEKASYFDPSLVRVVHHLSDSEAERFPTWQMLMNAAAQPRDDDE